MKRRVVKVDSDKLPFDLDRAVKSAHELMQKVISQLEKEGKIPPHATRKHKSQRA